MPRRPQELLRGDRELKCCSQSTVWHRIHGRTFKLGEPVEVASSGESFGWGIVTGNSGENLCCGNVRNRFLLEVTYDDGSRYHCLPCTVRRSACSAPPESMLKHVASLKPNSNDKGKGKDKGAGKGKEGKCRHWATHGSCKFGDKCKFTHAEAAPLATREDATAFDVTAVGVNGGECVVQGLMADMFVVEFRQRLARQLGQQIPGGHGWLVKLLVSGRVPKDMETLGEIGIMDKSASVTFVIMSKDKRAWQWTMARLLQVLRSGDHERAREIVEEVVKGKGKFHLVHLLKSVCLAGDMPFLELLAERVPSEVLCQMLLINRGSTNDRYRQRGASVLYSLWEFHYESYKSLCVRLFEAGHLEKLLAMFGDETALLARMFDGIWPEEWKNQESRSWLQPLRGRQSCEELLQALENPAHQPAPWKARHQEFMAELQDAGFSYRDHAALISQEVCYCNPERLTAADCAKIPEALKPLLLKWTSSDGGMLHRRQPNWEDAADEYIGSCLDALIEAAGLVSMASAVPNGLSLLHMEPAGKELREARFLEQISAGKVLGGEKSEAFVLTAALDMDGLGCVKLWGLDGLQDGSRVRTLGHGFPARTAMLSKDNASVLTANSDGVARLLSVADGSCQGTFAHSTHPVLTAATFSAGDSLVLTAAEDGKAKLWSVEDGSCKQTFSHANTVNSAVFSVDNTVVLTASDDGTAKLWSVQDGTCLQTFAGHASEINAAALSADNAMVLTAGYDNLAKLWCVEGIAQESIWSCKQNFNHRSSLTLAAFSPDTTLALTASESGAVCLWATNDFVCRQVFSHSGEVATATFVAGDLLLTSGGAHQRQAVKLWSVADGACIRTFACGDPKDTGDMGMQCFAAFCESRGMVVAALSCGIAKVWSIEDCVCRHTLQHHEKGEGRLKAVAFSQ